MAPPRKLRDGRPDSTAPAGITPARSGKPQRLALWQRVAIALEHDILSRVFSVGSRLPTDVALAERFKVNRHTARRALLELVRKGLLKSQPQVGHFVAPFRLVYPIRPETRLSETVERAGFTPSLRLVRQEERTPPESIARALDVAGRTKVIELEVVRLANALPVALVTYWLPADRFAKFSQQIAATGGVRGAMARAGVRRTVRLSSRIFSRLADEAEARHLELEPGSPLLCLEVIDADAEGEPVVVVVYRFNASRTDLIL